MTRKYSPEFITHIDRKKRTMTFDYDDGTKVIIHFDVNGNFYKEEIREPIEHWRYKK